MAVDYPYTTEERIVALAGQLAIDLRLDDSPDAASDLEDAIDAGTADLDYYLSRYSQATCAESEWVLQHGTFFALRALCLRRLNSVPEGLAKELERREEQLENVRKGKAKATRLPASRRAVAVTNHSVVLRRFNNTVRVDKARSTGVAKDYRRPLDDAAPDER